MNGAINESTFNFFFKLNYNKTFTAILSTPLSPGDIAARRARLGADPRRPVRRSGSWSSWSCSGCSSRRGSILAVPAALLVGFAFGAVGMAATSFMKTWQDFDLIQLVVLPMFLFSGTFYPIDDVPGGAPGLRPADAALPGRRPDPVADGRGDLADPAGPRRVPVDHGLRSGWRRVAPARQAAAQVACRRTVARPGGASPP